MHSKDLAIGVLSTTGVILLVGLVVIQTRPATTLASGMTTTSGDYVLTVGMASIGSEEYVYVIDAPSEALGVYRFNGSRSEIQLLERIDLKAMRTQVQPAQQQRARPGGARGRRP